MFPAVFVSRDGAVGQACLARLHGAGARIFTDLGRLEPLEARMFDEDRQRLRAAMGDVVFGAEPNSPLAVRLTRRTYWPSCAARGHWMDRRQRRQR